jgi:hypothetical protein
MSTTNTTHAVDPSSIEVSNHAEWRGVHRLGIIERTRDRLRELVERAEPSDLDYGPGSRGWRCGDVVVITDLHAETIKTVVVEADR